MKSLRKVIGYFAGWPGIAAVLVVVVSVGMYFDARGFSSVTERKTIHKLLAGYTLKAEGYTFFYAVDGKVVGKVAQVYDVGEWEALDEVYCEQWQIWGDGIRRCWTLETNGDLIKRTGTGFPFNENDVPINKLQRIKGNQVNSR